jgi:predicted small metal-binding protein
LEKKKMGRLACQNYGFACNFMTKKDVVEKVIQEFREHTIQEHYIDYPEGILMRFVMRKKYGIN